MKDLKLLKQEYNRIYYLKNKERIIKQNSEYQRKPKIIEKRRIRIKQRYKDNHLNYRTKSLRSHDNVKQNPEWWIKQRARISICGIRSYDPIKNKIKWAKYYKEHKEEYKAKRRTDKSISISNALRRLENNRTVSKKEQLNDIRILKQEIENLKQK